MKVPQKLVLILFLVFVTGISVSRAEIIDSSSYGFTVRHEYLVKTVPDSLYLYFYRDISQWWSSMHTFSGNAVNLILQPKANGCFCEKLKDGGSAKHMTVIYAEPGSVIRLSGGLGPLQGMAVNGVLTVEIKAEGGSAKMIMTYVVGGYSATSIGSLAPKVDRVLGEQFAALKHFAESRP